MSQHQRLPQSTRSLTLLWLLVPLGGLACGHRPASVVNRKLFTTFDPSGSWTATGEFMHTPAAAVPILVTGLAGAQVFNVVRGQGTPAELAGKGLVDGEDLYVVYGQDAAMYEQLWLFQSAKGQGANDLIGIGTTPRSGLGYEEWTWDDGGFAFRTPKFMGEYAAVSVDPPNTLGGAESSYKSRAFILADGDHKTVSWHGQADPFEGAGFVTGEKLVTAVVATSTIRQQPKAGYVIAAYHFKDGKLEGESLLSSNRIQDKARNSQERRTVETWTRAAAPAPAPAPAPGAAPAPTPAPAP